MTFQNHSFKVERTAHFSTYGELGKETKFIWYVFHGYGQLAKKLIRKFDFLDKTMHFVVAPEGLNRFYWHGNNEPVACWMTKEDRYDEIEDFTNYIEALYGLHTSHVNHDVTKILLGFSQGCATAWRWLHARKPTFDVMINWAGWIPEDISYRHMENYLIDKKIHVVYGNGDQFITAEISDQMQQLIQQNRLKVKTTIFNGGHKIPKETLETFYEEEISSFAAGSQ